MFIKNDVFVIAHLIIGGWGTRSEKFYKIYDIKKKKSAVISEKELNKHKDLIFNINRDRNWEKESDDFCRNVSMYIDSNYDKDILLHNFASNKKPDLSLYQYIQKEKELSKKYTIIERGEDYVIGINNRESRKMFAISDIISMSSNELTDIFNLSISVLAFYQIDAKKEIEDYLNCMENKGDYKFKNNEEEKRNLSRVIVGADYIVRSNGDIVIKQNSKRININIKRHDYSNIVLKGEYLEIRNVESFKILTGPRVLKSLEGLGENLGNVEVVLPVTLEKIESKAFMNSHIREIDLTRCKNLKYIGPGAFKFSTLEGLKIPDTVTHMGQFIVNSCKNLKYFIMPKGYETFDPTWIEACERLETLVLPEYPMNDWASNKKNCLARCLELKEIYTSEANLDIARDIVNKAIDVRRFLAKRKIINQTLSYDIRITIVRRKD